MSIINRPKKIVLTCVAMMDIVLGYSALPAKSSTISIKSLLTRPSDSFSNQLKKLLVERTQWFKKGALKA